MSQEISILAKYFIAAAICFIIQLVPIVSIFCMIFGSFFWIGMIVHIAILHISIRVILKKSSLLWLLLPIGYYVGGVTLHFASVNAAKSEVGNIEAQNNAFNFKIDPPFSFIADGSSNQTSTDSILLKYRIDSIFIKGKDQKGKEQYVVHTYKKGYECSTITGDFFSAKQSQSYRVTADLFPQYHGGDKTRQCIVGIKLPTAELPRYRIKMGNFNDKEIKSWTLNGEGSSLTIFDEIEGKEISKVQVVDFQVPAIIPFVVAGCFLNSGSARMQCGLSLHKSSSIISAGYDHSAAGRFYNTAVLVQSLFAQKFGLSVRQPHD
jgi:hypothetical protein